MKNIPPFRSVFLAITGLLTLFLAVFAFVNGQFIEGLAAIVFFAIYFFLVEVALRPYLNWQQSALRQVADRVSKLFRE